MASKFKILAVGVTAALISSLATLPSVAAVVPKFAYGASAGGTKVTAVGTTITSSPTAQAAIYGETPTSDSNKAASVDVGNLVDVGAVNTDVSSVAQDDGFAARSHTRTANISLLNGAITVQAIDTTSTASSSDAVAPQGATDSQLVGLVINGKQYPMSVARNTGVTIPGVATVLINASNTAVDGGTVVTFGSGLLVRLLSQQGGVAAGAEILLNPTFAMVQPAPQNPNAPSLGGVGYGAYAQSKVGNDVQAETGRLAYYAVPLAGTNGNTLNNHVAQAHIGSLFNLGAIDTDVMGITTENYAKVAVMDKLANVNVFQQLLGGLISATAFGTSAQVEMIDNKFTLTGGLQFVNLRIAGKAIPVDVAPNTTMHVANLGTVTINQQQTVEVPGWVHAMQVVGLDIVLDTAGYGLPVGAEVQVGVSQALIWR